MKHRVSSQRVTETDAIYCTKVCLTLIQRKVLAQKTPVCENSTRALYHLCANPSRPEQAPQAPASPSPPVAGLAVAARPRGTCEAKGQHGGGACLLASDCARKYIPF